MSGPTSGGRRMIGEGAATGRRTGWATILGVALFAGYLGAALAAQRTGMPWEPAIAVLPLGGLLLWRFLLRRPLAALGLRSVSSWSRHLVAPLLAASLLAVAALAVEGALGLRGFGAPAESPWVWAAVLLLLAPAVAGLFTAAVEEFVFRGFYQHALALALGTLLAAGMSAALFALAHLPIIVATGSATGVALALRLLMLFGFGLLMSWAVVRTGALWFPIAWHAGTNYPGVVAQFLLDAHGAEGVAGELFGLAAFAVQGAVALVLLHRLAWQPPRS